MGSPLDVSRPPPDDPLPQPPDDPLPQLDETFDTPQPSVGGVTLPVDAVQTSGQVAQMGEALPR